MDFKCDFVKNLFCLILIFDTYSEQCPAKTREEAESAFSEIPNIFVHIQKATGSN